MTKDTHTYFKYVGKFYIEASRGAGAKSVTLLWIRLPLEELKCLLFPLSRFGVGTKRGVQFRYSTRNSIALDSAENGEQRVLIVGFLCLPY